MSAIARRAPRVLAILALVQALSSASARADDKDAKAAAKEHYQKGTSFYDLGRYPEAIKEFEAAYELKNDPAFLYNLAQSYRQVGDADQALHFYRTYLRYVPKAPNRAEIEERIAALEKQLAEKGSTPIQPPAGGGATIPPPVGPGTGTTGTAGATTPPPNPDSPAVTVTGAGNGSPTPSYGSPAPTLSTTAPPPTSGRPHTFQTAGIYTAIGGGVLFAIGVIEGIRAQSASNEIENEAKNGIRYDPAVQSRGQSAGKAEGVFITLGILAAAAGGGLWYYGKRLGAAESTTSYRISFAPVVSPSGAGGWLQVGF